MHQLALLALAIVVLAFAGANAASAQNMSQASSLHVVIAAR